MIDSKFVPWMALGIAILANIGANLALKQAVDSMTKGTIGEMLFQLLQETNFWIGITLACLLFISYLIAIKQIPVSVAYVITTSLAMLGLIVVENMFYGLTLNSSKIFGAIMIIVGVLLLAT